MEASWRHHENLNTEPTANLCPSFDFIKDDIEQKGNGKILLPTKDNTTNLFNI